MKFTILTALLISITSLAQGQINLVFSEGLGGLTISASGTFQVSFEVPTNAMSSGIRNSFGVQSIRSAPNPNQSYYQDPNEGGDLPIILTIDETGPTSRTGDTFGFFFNPANTVGGSLVFGPANFSSNPLDPTNAVEGTITFASLGFAELGISEGQSGSFFIGGQTYNWSIVPEPSTYAALLGLTALGLVAWRKYNRL